MTVAAVSRTTAPRRLVPAAVVLAIPHIARHLDQRQRQTRLRIERVKRQRRLQARTRRPNALVARAPETVLAARPLGDGEAPGRAVVGRLANVPPVGLGVEEVVGLGARVGGPVDVEDGEALARVHGAAPGAVLVLAEPELAHVVRRAVLPGRVGLDAGPAVVAEVLPVFHLEEVAFSCGGVSQRD